MSDNPQTAAPETAPAETPEAFTPDDIDRKFFDPAQMSDAVAYIDAINGVWPQDKILLNFNPEEPLPDGYGILVQPVTKRSEKKEGNELVKVIIAGVPTVSTVLNAGEKGSDFILKAVLDQFASKLLTASRIADEKGAGAARTPFSLEEFIERRTKGETLKTFTELCKLFVPSLRQMGLKSMTNQILRMVLSSTATAESKFPKIAQDNWLKVLDAMIAKAKEKNLDPSILEEWKATRDRQQTIEDISEIDLDKLDGLLAGQTG